MTEQPQSEIERFADAVEELKRQIGIAICRSWLWRLCEWMYPLRMPSSLMADELGAALPVMSTGGAMMEWIKVTDRLPDDGYHYLVYDDREMFVAFFYRGRWSDFDTLLTDVTHWCKLPDPPTQ